MPLNSSNGTPTYAKVGVTDQLGTGVEPAYEAGALNPCELRSPRRDEGHSLRRSARCFQHQTERPRPLCRQGGKGGVPVYLIVIGVMPSS